jgi:type II secretory pathway component PulM
VDGLVWFRESWRLDAEQRARLAGAGSGAAALQAVTWLRRHESLPRHVFARIPEEGKPVALDLASLPFAELLCWLATRGSDLVLSEALPGPDQLALRLPAGDFTSELRISVLVEHRR